MLPEGFRFETRDDDIVLRLGDSKVAHACPANYDPNPPWRLCLNPDRLGMRYHFTDSREAAERYLVAWATKWQDRLREQKPANPMSCYAGLNVGSAQEAKYPRRRKRKR